MLEQHAQKQPHSKALLGTNPVPQSDEANMMPIHVWQGNLPQRIQQLVFEQHNKAFQANRNSHPAYLMHEIMNHLFVTLFVQP